MYSQGNEAIHAETQSTGVAAIAAYNLNPDATGAALYAEKRGNSGHAGFFNGNVYITGSIHADNMMCNNADCAEYFEVDNSGSVEPGTVMVLGDEGAYAPVNGRTINERRSYPARAITSPLSSSTRGTPTIRTPRIDNPLL